MTETLENVKVFLHDEAADDDTGMTIPWCFLQTRIPRNAVSRLPALFHKIEVNL